MTSSQDYVPRLVDPLIETIFTALPAVMMVGPRAAGKTTTARRFGTSFVQLDRGSVAEAVRVDPDAALTAYDEPVIIDEWQIVPEVLGAVKRTVDENPAAGRFLLTGSTSADLTAAGWPATGRVVRVPLWGLVERELEGDVTARPFLSRLLEDGIEGVSLPKQVPNVRGYVERALRSGFPEAARLSSAKVRRVWLASYVDQLVTRDVPQAGVARDQVRLRRYLQAIAGNTAGLPQHKVLYDAAEIDRVTGSAYDDLLETLFVTERVPAWSSSRTGRAIRTPKRYLTEPALVGPLLGLDTRAVMRDADLLGRVVDTFVAAQLRAELPVCDEEPTLFHLRDTDGRHEVDLLAETTDGRVAAFEIKAHASPGPDAARHLRWLRDRLDERFAIGVVLHTGPLPFPLDDQIIAVPICAIWG